MKRWLYVWVLLPSLVWRSEAGQTLAGSRLSVQHLLNKQSYSAAAVQIVEEQFSDLGSPLPALTALVSDKNSEVRMIVAQLVAQLGIAEGAQLLWKLLRDDNEGVQLFAMQSLGKLNEITPVAPDVSGLQNSRARVRRFTVEALGRLHNRTVAADLIKALADEDDLVRWQAVIALGACGNLSVLPALSLRLNDTSARVRRATIEVMARLGGATVGAQLVAALDDGDWQTRAIAARALATLVQESQADRAAMTATILAKLKPDDRALIAALQALGLANDDRALGGLVRALTGSDRGLATYAMQVIVGLRITPVLPFLAGYSHHANPVVRQRVIEVFGKVGGTNEIAMVVTALADPVDNVQLAAVTALRQLRQYASPERLTGMLMHADAHVRAAAARYFGDLGDRRFANQVAMLLFDENRFVRSAAIEALGKLGDRSTIGLLLEVLNRQTPGGELTGRRQLAGRGVMMGASRSLPPLLSGLELLAQKAEAIKVLGDWRATEAVVSIIENGLQVPGSQLLAVSAYALGQIGDRRALGPLLTLVQDYYTVAAFEAESAKQMTISDQALSQMFHQEYELQCNARRTMIWALGRLGDAAAIPTLRQALTDRNSTVREAAVEALAQFPAGSQLYAAVSVRLSSPAPFLPEFISCSPVIQ